MKIPILIVIPYWKGDLEQARELVKIIAGLQAHHVKSSAHVMISMRQDAPHDQNIIKTISSKFNTLTFRCNSPLRGWPNGANGMFASTMIHIAISLSQNYECVYWMEPDCIPLRANWFWDLYLEWKKRHPSANIIGCRHDCNGDGTGDHITGCAIYHPNIAKILPDIMRCDGIAWDYQHRAKIVRMGAHTNLIQNHYKATTGDPRIIEQNGVCIIHGFKTNFVSNLVKAKFRIP